MKAAPYGSWRSPITSALIVEGAVTLTQVEVSGEDVYWIEGRPEEGGRQVVVRWHEGEVADITPEGFSARTRVHEYGGGAFAVQASTVFFSNWADQRVYRQDGGGPPTPITPEPEEASGIRYADGRVTPDGRFLVCVRERHKGGREAVNEIVAIPTDGSTEPRILVGGTDFVAYPRLSLDGRSLCWTCWNHPNMPWDGTELWVASLSGEPELDGARLVAGGPEESICQPLYGPDGALYFVSDRTGWWNLYRDGDPVAPLEADFGVPQWLFATSTYTVLGDGTPVCVYKKDGADRLGVVRPSGLEQLDVPWTSMTSPRAFGDGIVLIAATPSDEPAVVEIDLVTLEGPVLRRSRERSVDSGYVSQPEAVEFPTEGGLTAHALFYPPANRDFEGAAGEFPPLLVLSHGGPTSATSASLNLSLQYWTSRGFAVVDVNYGGSTGYGRAYRERLKGNWGVVDVDDCVNAARWLASRGQVDASRKAIRGGSAGGYTTLCALTFRDEFSAGASYYGVADAETLAKDTHKFESRYLDGLIGPYPEARSLYRDRSPIDHADGLSCPVIIFQGLEDEIVPPSQAEQMVEALRQKRLPFAYITFEGEQHGFRIAANIRRALDAELYFYSKVFGFEPADEIEPVEIENL